MMLTWMTHQTGFALAKINIHKSPVKLLFWEHNQIIHQILPFNKMMDSLKIGVIKFIHLKYVFFFILKKNIFQYIITFSHY